jgi:hypothetical protein
LRTSKTKWMKLRWSMMVLIETLWSLIVSHMLMKEAQAMMTRTRRCKNQTSVMARKKAAVPWHGVRKSTRTRRPTAHYLCYTLNLSFKLIRFFHHDYYHGIKMRQCNV